MSVSDDECHNREIIGNSVLGCKNDSYSSGVTLDLGSEEEEFSMEAMVIY